MVYLYWIEFSNYHHFNFFSFFHFVHTSCVCVCFFSMKINKQKWKWNKITIFLLSNFFSFCWKFCAKSKWKKWFFNFFFGSKIEWDLNYYYADDDTTMMMRSIITIAWSELIFFCVCVFCFRHFFSLFNPNLIIDMADHHHRHHIVYVMTIIKLFFFILKFKFSIISIAKHTRTHTHTHTHTVQSVLQWPVDWEQKKKSEWVRERKLLSKFNLFIIIIIKYTWSHFVCFYMITTGFFLFIIFFFFILVGSKNISVDPVLCCFFFMYLCVCLGHWLNSCFDINSNRFFGKFHFLDVLVR